MEHALPPSTPSGPAIAARSRTRTTCSTGAQRLGVQDGEHCPPRAADLRGARRPRSQASVVNNLGIHAYYEGRWDESLEHYRQSGELKERAGDVIGAASR